VVNQPAKIGKYDVLRVIGRGGMGVVYEALDPKLQRHVAIKMILGATPGLLARFDKEARSTASLQHPNIVTIHEFGDQSGNPYLVMEYLEGMSLAAALESGQPLSLVNKLSICADLCNGLNYAHERGIIHRDIKPANIMLLTDGNIKIVDFGIARIGDTGISRTETIGTLDYMSPEQFQSQTLDSRTDIFSTGVLLYKLLTGALPFQALGGEAAVMFKIVHEDPPPLSLYLHDYPSDLDGIVSKALAKNRDLRYATARDFAFDLLMVLEKQKDQEVAQWMTRAETATQKSDWGKAEEYLRQALRADKHHMPAHQMLSQVQQRLRQQQNAEQVRQLRLQADEAFLSRRYDDALSIADQAIAVDKTNQDVLTLRQRIREAKDREARVQSALRRAEQAEQMGDLEEAKLAVDEALQIDPHETSVKALQVVILRQAEERKRQQQLRQLFDNARDQITARNLTGAFNTLKQAEAIDPASLELYSLLKVVSAAREEQFRSQELGKIAGEIESALSRQDFRAALSVAEEGLRRHPNEPSLLKLKNLAETEQRRAQVTAYSRQQVVAANNLLESGKSAEALSVVERALKNVPGDAHLEELLRIVKKQVAVELAAEKERQVLARARQLADGQQFGEAVRLLESAQREFPTSEKVLESLERVRAVAKKTEIVDQTISRAQQLLDQRSAEDAIRFLETETLAIPDTRLFTMLETARRERDQFRSQLRKTVDEGTRILRELGGREAEKYLSLQLAKYLDTPELRVLSGEVAKQRAWEVLEEELARNSDPDKRVQLAEIALRDNPGNEKIQTRLAAVRSQRQQIAAIIENVNSLERTQEYLKAGEELARLRQFYPAYPNLDAEIRRIERLEEQRKSEDARRRQEKFQIELQASILEGKRILQERGGRECQKYLLAQPDKYKQTTPFQSLAEQAAQRIAVETLELTIKIETDPAAQVRAAEDALRENPGHEEIKKKLAELRIRKKQIDEVLKKSKAREAKKNYREARLELHKLRELNPPLPGIELEIRRLEQLEEESRKPRKEPSKPRQEEKISAQEASSATRIVSPLAVHEKESTAASSPAAAASRLATARPHEEPQHELTPHKTGSMKYLLPVAVIVVAAALWIGYRAINRPTNIPVKLNLVPADSTVTIDGTLCPVPCQLALAPGSHRLDANHTGYAELTRKFDVSRDASGEFSFELQLLPTPTLLVHGTLVLEANVNGADILIDHQSSGQTKNDGFTMQLSPGSHTVRLQKEGYEEIEKQITVVAGHTATVSFKLVESKHLPDALELLVQGPAGGQIILEGRSYEIPENGERKIPVQPGQHQIEVRARGFQDWTESVTVSANGSNQIAANMKRDAPTPQPPPIPTPASTPSPTGTFEPDRRVISQGESSTLRWNIQNAVTVKVEGKVVEPNGSMSIKPTDTKTYHLVAIGAAQAEHDMETTIVVNIPLPPAPNPSPASSPVLSVSEQDQSAISDLLNRYAQSYEHRDAKSIEAIWPNIPKSTLDTIKKAFKQNARLSFSDFSFIREDEQRVRVKCKQSISEQVDGNDQHRVVPFSLIVKQKDNKDWLIDYVLLNN
jgi:eukaryotic-like serine/threonine-protein kinase